MTTAIERLEDLLNQAEEKIEVLEQEKKKQRYLEDWGWMRTTTSEEKESLPVPRLEIRWTKLDGYITQASYNLVTRHFLGHVVRYPLGMTRCCGYHAVESLVHEGDVPTPLRDGAHILHDMAHLNLPGFAIYEGKVTKLSGG